MSASIFLLKKNHLQCLFKLLVHHEENKETFSFHFCYENIIFTMIDDTVGKMNTIILAMHCRCSMTDLIGRSGART